MTSRSFAARIAAVRVRDRDFMTTKEAARTETARAVRNTNVRLKGRLSCVFWISGKHLRVSAALTTVNYVDVLIVKRRHSPN